MSVVTTFNYSLWQIPSNVPCRKSETAAREARLAFATAATLCHAWVFFVEAVGSVTDQEEWDPKSCAHNPTAMLGARAIASATRPPSPTARPAAASPNSSTTLMAAKAEGWISPANTGATTVMEPPAGGFLRVCQ